MTERNDVEDILDIEIHEAAARILDDTTPSALEIVDMQLALQLQGLGTGLVADGIWTEQWVGLYRLWLDEKTDM